MYHDQGYTEKLKMSDWEYLTLERDNRILVVSFDSLNQVNSLNIQLMRELTALAIELQQDNDLSAIILRGRDTMFTGGMDLKDAEIVSTRHGTVAEERILAKVGPSMCAAWETLEPVTIVAIEGWCIGGGVALAVACDWRVAGSDSKIYVPELKLGMNMSWQSIPRLVNLIGPAKTKELLILAEPQDAGLAKEWGLVDHIAESGEALNKAKTIANKIAKMPPIPVRMTKRAATVTATALNNATSFMDLDQFMLTQHTSDAKEGIAAFFEKRKPKFGGH